MGNGALQLPTTGAERNRELVINQPSGARARGVAPARLLLLPLLPWQLAQMERSAGEGSTHGEPGREKRFPQQPWRALLIASQL